MIAQLEDAIRDSDQLSRDKRAELRGVISTRPGLNRYLRVTPGGLLRVDAGKIKAEGNLDGKYLLRTSDPKMSAEDIALGYKQLLQVERGWRCSWPASPRTLARTPGWRSAASSTGSTCEPSPARPAAHRAHQTPARHPHALKIDAPSRIHRLEAARALTSGDPTV
jgi:hypothetical protein